jgi:hypothetical protein
MENREIVSFMVGAGESRMNVSSHDRNEACVLKEHRGRY